MILLHIFALYFTRARCVELYGSSNASVLSNYSLLSSFVNKRLFQPSCGTIYRGNEIEQEFKWIYLSRKEFLDGNYFASILQCGYSFHLLLCGKLTNRNLGKFYNIISPRKSSRSTCSRPECKYEIIAHYKLGGTFYFRVEQSDCPSVALTFSSERKVIGGGSSFEVFAHNNITVTTCSSQDFFNYTYLISCNFPPLFDSYTHEQENSVVYLSVIISYEYFDGYAEGVKCDIMTALYDNVPFSFSTHKNMKKFHHNQQLSNVKANPNNFQDMQSSISSSTSNGANISWYTASWYRNDNISYPYLSLLRKRNNEFIHHRYNKLSQATHNFTQSTFFINSPNFYGSFFTSPAYRTSTNRLPTFNADISSQNLSYLWVIEFGIVPPSPSPYLSSSFTSFLPSVSSVSQGFHEHYQQCLPPRKLFPIDFASTFIRGLRSSSEFYNQSNNGFNLDTCLCKGCADTVGSTSSTTSSSSMHYIFMGASHIRYLFNLFVMKTLGPNKLKNVIAKHENIIIDNLEYMYICAAGHQAKILRDANVLREKCGYMSDNNNNSSVTLLFQTGHWDLSSATLRNLFHDNGAAWALIDVINDILTAKIPCGRLVKFIWLTAVPYPLCGNNLNPLCLYTRVFRSNNNLKALNDFYISQLINIKVAKSIKFSIVDVFHIIYPRVFFREIEEVVGGNHYLAREEIDVVYVTPGGLAAAHATNLAMCE